MVTVVGHTGAVVLASFLVSLVECVEALTVILAVGAVRSWRGALAGTGLGIAMLTLLIAGLGRALCLDLRPRRRAPPARSR